MELIIFIVSRKFLKIFFFCGGGGGRFKSAQSSFFFIFKCQISFLSLVLFLRFILTAVCLNVCGR